MGHHGTGGAIRPLLRQWRVESKGWRVGSWKGGRWDNGRLVNGGRCWSPRLESFVPDLLPLVRGLR